MTAARARVLELAADGLAWTRSGLAHAAGVSLTVIDGLRAQGVFEPVMIPPRPVVAAPDPAFAQPDLTPEQATAAAALRDAAGRPASASRCSTASPARARPRSISRRSPPRSSSGKQVLILLPEIALTQAFLERFHDRFGAKPAEWHSDLPPRMRERVWRQVAEGQRPRRRRRALGAVPAVPRTRPDRRRRGARPRLQAGGSRLLQRARHGGGARPHRRLPGRARLGDAVDRKPGQRAAGPLRPRRAAGALCRGGDARHRARSTCAGRRRRAAASCRRSCSAASAQTISRAASSRCCSSTAAAMRR